jgi:thioredoxin reductase
MPDVIVIGDGPAGLSAALFLAKNNVSVTVFGQDKTLLHKAMLYNYLGIPEMTGSEFVRRARKQVEGFGAQLRQAEVTAAEKTPSGFAVTTADGQRHQSQYLILATGPRPPLAQSLGLTKGKDEVVAERNGRTSVERLYAVGWSARTRKIQAIISAGDGAAAALDILSAEAGEEVHDFDVVEEEK